MTLVTSWSAVIARRTFFRCFPVYRLFSNPLSRNFGVQSGSFVSYMLGVNGNVSLGDHLVWLARVGYQQLDHLNPDETTLGQFKI